MNTPSRTRLSADDHTEVAVVGAGAAGLEAALVLGRQRRRVLLIDSGDYRNARSTGAHMLLGLDGTPPTEIRDRALADIAGLDTVIYLRSTVTAAHLDTEDGEGRTEPAVALTLSDGRRVSARRLIIATGQRDVTRDGDGVPLVNGLDRGHGIWTRHCPYCHGWENRDQDILVVPVPGVPVIRTVYQALYLRDRISDRVRIIIDAAEVPDVFRGALADAGVSLIDDTISTMSGGPDAVSVRTTGGRTIRADTVFATPPTTAGSPLGEMLGLQMQGPCILTDARQRSSVPQVFAAGDGAVRRGEPEPMTFVTQAAAQGQLAAIWADQDLFLAGPGIPAPSALPEASPTRPTAADTMPLSLHESTE